jgi:uncharacterized protein YdeI (YjbR/CyaY-like superfamily)
MYHPAIDEYINKSEEFARPILLHLRKIIHLACPDVEETIQWSFPNFEYKGQILCSMASFKKHCSFGFWLGAEMEDPENILNKVGNTNMGNFGKIINHNSLPDDNIIIKYIHEAMKLSESGTKKKTSKIKDKKSLEIPVYIIEFIEKYPKAKVVFNNFSNSCKKEYVQWIEEAKQVSTKLKRLEKAVSMMEEGKEFNWQYKK